MLNAVCLSFDVEYSVFITFGGECIVFITFDVD